MLDPPHRDAGPLRAGDPPEVMIALLYKELRGVATGLLRRERPNHTLQPTALVNEAFVRLAAHGEAAFRDRGQFLGAAAHLMREILIDYARTRNRAKRGGGQAALCIEDADGLSAEFRIDLLALDEALTRLEQVDSQQRRIVELRYFAGLSIEEAAAVAGVSPATVKREWRMAKAWLRRELKPVETRDE
jgi:RNA polymerase sigma factor (TIGR02999 family)